MSYEESPSGDDESEVFEFDCPECGTHIVGAVTKCPGCGVEFIIEEVEEFKCFECGQILPADTNKCPNCGAEFDLLVPEESETERDIEDTLAEAEPNVAEEPPEISPTESSKEEFPRLVAEVKPMMALAREFGVDASEAKGLIDEAVIAGKNGDLEVAVGHVRKCKASIESSIKDRVKSNLEELGNLRGITERMGEDPSRIQESMDLARRELTNGDLKAALIHSKEGMKRAETLTGKYIEAQNMIRDLERMVENAERFYIDVSKVRAQLEEAKAAEESGDYSMMGIMARKGREQMMQILPVELREELKRSKGILMDAKAEGKDVTMLVRLLKEAASGMSRDRYDESLERLVEFRSEIRRI